MDTKSDELRRPLLEMRVTFTVRSGLLGPLVVLGMCEGSAGQGAACVIVLCGSASGPKHREILQNRPNMGSLYSPSHFSTPWSDYWAADNDCYANRNDPDWWYRAGESAWLKMLDKIAVCESRPIFVLLPDVVADWPRTLERAYKYKRELHTRELTAALALQDGCVFTEARAVDAPVLFVGGSTRWKWLNVEPIRQEFWREWLHVGRVNGPRQIRECLRVGIDSVDGSGWTRFPAKRTRDTCFAALDRKYKTDNLTLL